MTAFNIQYPASTKARSLQFNSNVLHEGQDILSYCERHASPNEIRSDKGTHHKQ